MKILLQIFLIHILNDRINCKWITYLSATSVYGDHKGDWVNENSITKPSSANGINRLKAENTWLSLSSKKLSITNI